AELLLELLSEEIPARMQARAAEDLKRLAAEGLAKAGLAFGHIESFVTPRRLALVVDGLPAKQPDVAEERRGPRVDAPQQAIDGFLRANGITLDQCEQRDTGKGVFWFVNIHKKGAKTADVLPAIIEGALALLPWPKSMRWAGPARWVRPLRGIVCLFEGKVAPVSFAGAKAGSTTRGHRFLAPKPITVKNFADYKKKLFAAKVMLDAADRRGKILDDVARLAAAHGLVPVHDEGLLHEVAGLVEWPVVLLGRIDDAFMTLPPEVLTTTMRHHQKYFSLKDKSGKLAPVFAVVSNMETKDKGAAIVAGNERVLRARLSDARFFWDQDRKRSLAGRVDALKARLFHAKLGSDYDRVQRLRALASELSRYIPNADPVAAERAAELCKADLTTGMVG
ncbi:MAG: glycine--tRNA ligase subunit beta, partial [Pseudomonadota bacterium]